MKKPTLSVVGLNGLNAQRHALKFYLPIIFALFAGALVVSGQSALQPQRGVYTGGSYSVSQLETVNLQTGGMMLNFPLAALPQGRGNSGSGINLSYNSKIWDPQPYAQVSSDCADPQCNTHIMRHYNFAYPSQSGGGWSYALFYKLEEFNLNTEDRSGPDPFRCYYGDSGSPVQSPDPYVVNRRMKMPDGSTVYFRAEGDTTEGERDYNGRYRYDMEGRRWFCTPYSPQAPGHLDSTAPTYAPKTYYSTDGSRLRLDVSFSAPDQYNQRTRLWKLYYPDGSRVESSGRSEFENLTSTALPGVIHIEKYDRNGNRTIIEKNNSTVTISDSVGREVKITDFESAEEHVISQGTAGENVEWKVKWKYISIPLNRILSSGYSAIGGTGTQQWKVIDQVISPSQMGSQVYTFEYNQDAVGSSQGTGELSAFNLPSGARAEYSYNTDGQTNLTTVKMLGNHLSQKKLNYQVQADGSSESKTDTWSYTRVRNGSETTGSPGTTSLTTSTDPTGAQTTETYYITPDLTNGRLHTRVTPDGTKTEDIWEAEVRPLIGVLNVEYGNVHLKTELAWIRSQTDSPGTFSFIAAKDYKTDQNGNITQIKEYDWLSPGSITYNQSTGQSQLSANTPPARITNNSYANATLDASDTDTSSTNVYWKNTSPALKNVPVSVEITDGNAVVKSRSEFGYDNYSTTGNLTSVKSWDSFKGGGSFKPVTNPLTYSNSISTTVAYDAYGNPTSTTDANGNITQTTYGPITTSSGTVSELYPTQTVAAYGTSLARTSTAAYDFYTGLVTSATEVDNNLSAATTYDALGRPTLAATGVGTTLEGRTQTTYDDTNRMIVVKADLFTKGDGKKVATQFYDQLGRVRLSKTLEDASTQSATNETDGIKVQTRYLTTTGYSYQVTSNPYRAATSAAASGEPEMGWTRSAASSTGRHAETETFSGATLPAPFLTTGYNTASTGAVKTDNDADRTLVTDQAGRQRISKSNGLGQLTDVWEVKASDAATVSVSFPGQSLAAGYQTSYAYDTLNNLTTVNQGAQTRSFTYSSLSRLTSATNPEAGAISYVYDAGGNLTSKTDARSITTVYAYDALNRVTGRTYSDTVTHPVTYTYGTSAPAIGKLTKVVTGPTTAPISTTEYTAFDILGRVTAHKQTTGGNDYTTAYTYNLSGALLEETYPNGRVVKNTLDANGDLSNVQSRKDAAHPFNLYAGMFSYTAAGAVNSMILGNGKWESTIYNSRLQPMQIALGGAKNATDLLKLNYTYNTKNSNQDNPDNNGNILTQQTTVQAMGTQPGFSATQTYTYDELNRLSTAEEKNDATSGQMWKQSFTFDRYGNRNFNEANTTATATFPKACGIPIGTAVCAADRKVSNPEILSSNKLKGDQDGDSLDDYKYDPAGNTTQAPFKTSSSAIENRTYAYDAENKQIQVTVTGSSAPAIGQYVYDGDGKRVKKLSATEETVFVYDAVGKMIAEYSVAPNPGTDVSYLTADNLSTPRINTDQLGAVISRHDYQPYGEEIATPERNASLKYQDDAVRKQFTGYERDQETDLDYAQARYYAKNQGRFNSTDPIMMEGRRIIDPQGINLYVYARNNPLQYTDPDGKYYVGTDGKKVKVKYLKDKQGNIIGIKRLGKNATSEVKEIASLISKFKSETALSDFVRGDATATRVIVSFAEGVTDHSVEKKGADGVPVYIKDPHSGKFINEEVTIILSNAAAFGPMLEHLRDVYDDPNLTLEEIKLSNFGHELEHMLDVDYIQMEREVYLNKELTPEQRKSRLYDLYLKNELKAEDRTRKTIDDIKKSLPAKDFQPKYQFKEK